jgi:hypothetical protein
MKNKNNIDLGIKGIYQTKKTDSEISGSVTETMSTEQNNTTSSLRSIFSTLSLRRRKGKKTINIPQQKIEIDSSLIISHYQTIPAASVVQEPKEPIYDVIDSSNANIKQMKVRAKILTPDEELWSPLLTNINDNPQLKEILNKVRFSDVFDQIKWIQQFSKGLINNTESIDYIKIIIQVDSSLNAIIEEFKLAKDKCISLKNLALQSSLYLFEHDLWNEFIPKEKDYEVIEGDYEIMQNQRLEDVEKEPKYMDMNQGKKPGFFAIYTNIEVTEADKGQQEEIRFT